MEKLELDTKGKKAELVERLQAHIDAKKNETVDEEPEKAVEPENDANEEKNDEPENQEEPRLR